MPDTGSLSTNALRQWIADKLDVQKIRENLQALGLDEDSVDAHVREFKKMKYAKKQFRGFICLATGAFLGFVSCVLALTNPLPDMYNWFLYGLTSVAIIIICTGLYFVFE
jgi:hypothetical protein